MKRMLVAVIALCICVGASAQTSITDATGRTIAIRQRVDRVYAAGDSPPWFTGNLVNLSVEDVLLAAPDVIIASDPSFAAAVRAAPAWRDVPAVRTGRIFVPPDVPFG